MAFSMLDNGGSYSWLLEGMTKRDILHLYSRGICD